MPRHAGLVAGSSRSGSVADWRSTNSGPTIYGHDLLFRRLLLSKRRREARPVDRLAKLARPFFLRAGRLPLAFVLWPDAAPRGRCADAFLASWPKQECFVIRRAVQAITASIKIPLQWTFWVQLTLFYLLRHLCLQWRRIQCRIDSEAWLLLSGFWHADFSRPFFNWTTNGRSVLPLAPRQHRGSAQSKMTRNRSSPA